MGYWRGVVSRAWRATAKAARVESREAVVILLLTQAATGAVLWFALGRAGLESNLWGRAAAAATPFLVFIPIFVWKLVTTPPMLAKEERQQREQLEAAFQAKDAELLGRSGGLENQNAQIAQLLETISELLARETKHLATPAVPPRHLQDLRPATAPQIRSMVNDVTQKMRNMENAFQNARNSILFGPREDCNVYTNRLMAQSQEQANRWRTELMPEAVALRDELRRRIYGAPPYPGDPSEVALEHGMLAGPSPLADAAVALEQLARDIPG